MNVAPIGETRVRDRRGTVLPHGFYCISLPRVLTGRSLRHRIQVAGPGFRYGMDRCSKDVVIAADTTYHRSHDFVTSNTIRTKRQMTCWGCLMTKKCESPNTADHRAPTVEKSMIYLLTPLFKVICSDEG